MASETFYRALADEQVKFGIKTPDQADAWVNQEMARCRELEAEQTAAWKRLIEAIHRIAEDDG